MTKNTTSENIIQFCKDLDENIGEMIFNLRKEYGLSRTLLAENLGVSVQQLCKYESGVNKLSIGRLLLICEYFKCDIDYFIKNVWVGNLAIKPMQSSKKLRNLDKLTPKQLTLINKMIIELTN